MKKFFRILLGIVVMSVLWWIFSSDRIATEDGYIVYSGPVEGVDACTSYEQFDAELQECFFTCVTAGECDAIEEQIDAELDQWEEEYAAFAENFLEQQEEIAPEHVRAVYVVHADEEIILQKGEEHIAHQQLWRLFAQISPDAFTEKYVNSFTVYDDGRGETAAFVAQSPTDLTRWDVFINLAGSDGESQKDKIFTFVHEFAHVYTLNASQVNIAIDAGACSQFFTGEGCAYDDAYINQFVQQFWSEDDLRAVFAGDDGGRMLYDEAPDKFVTAYAATNPGEDIAESFATFIFSGKESDAQSIAQQKIAFFESFPEVAVLRSDIRSALRIDATRAYRRVQ